MFKVMDAFQHKLKVRYVSFIDVEYKIETAGKIFPFRNSTASMSYLNESRIFSH